MSEPPRTFTLVLRAERNVDDPLLALRACLKQALRAYGLRCIRCEPHRDEQTQELLAGDKV